MYQQRRMSNIGSNNPPSSEDKVYVGLETLQEQTRVKALRKGFIFNLMVAGRSGLGKSTLVNTLFKTNVSCKNGDYEAIPSTTEIHSKSTTLTEKGVTLSLTITDTPGFGDQINNENCWEPIAKFIETQYANYLAEEQQLERPSIIPDTRVHCCLYFIQPSGHALTSLDVEVLQRLCRIVNVIPVIAKADTLTLEERKCFKERIRADLLYHKINTYPLTQYEDEEDALYNANIREMIPFGVIGSTCYHEVQGKKVLGRKTVWGFAEVENKSHSDFPFLRDLLIRSHMTNLCEVTATYFYEEFRKNVLSSNDVERRPRNEPEFNDGNRNAEE